MSRNLKVMLSSRCDSQIPFADGAMSLTELRTSLKKGLEEATFLDQSLFEVWINEDAPPATGGDTSWEQCLRQADDAEIFIALYSGEAGWAKEGGDIGICHAELEAALNSGRAKVRLVKLPEPTDLKHLERDGQFQEYVKRQNIFRGGNVGTSTEARTRVFEAVRSAVVEMTRRGRSNSSKDKYDRGEALDWTRMSFAKRKETMEISLAKTLGQRSEAEVVGPHAFLKIEGKKVLFRLAAIPGPMSIAEARELVGRPHLDDHTVVEHLADGKKFGPVQLIACQRGVTERQALTVLGFPDAAIVKSGFGVFVADNIQKAQMVFLENCRDDTTTRHVVQQFFDWLDHSGETQGLLERAVSRKRIIKTIADERSI
jgi:hypothetical protein